VRLNFSALGGKKSRSDLPLFKTPQTIVDCAETVFHALNGRRIQPMSTKVFRLSTLFFVVFMAITAAGFECLVLAQESTNQNAAADTSTQKPTTTRRRRGRRHRAATTTTATDATPAAPAEPAVVAAAPETTEQTDLSGTYTGTFECGDAGVSGPTTLTVTGNQFTLTDGKTGRIVASTTRGYTGVAMQFGEVVMATSGQPAGPPPTIVSMRARKSGDRLTLTTVPGATHVCSFTTTGASGRMRHRRTQMPAAPVTSAEPAMPATEMPATPAGPAPPATPTRRRGRRGSRRANMNTNMNTNTNSNTNTNDNTGTTEGNVSATPTPTPAVPRN
jgi:hypothetical protein